MLDINQIVESVYPTQYPWLFEEEAKNAREYRPTLRC
jgi:hypothetical protein